MNVCVWPILLNKSDCKLKWTELPYCSGLICCQTGWRLGAGISLASFRRFLGGCCEEELVAGTIGSS